jgi:phosphocarrier protein HPr
MIKSTITIINKLGLHLRASSKLSQTATQYPCEVWLSRGSKRINAKSVLGVTMLAAGPGTEIEIECDGDREDEAMAAIRHLIDDKFGEGE